MGLPGSGKSYLSEHLTQMIDGIWLNADKVREEANDWDFSIEGRQRQALRMAKLSEETKELVEFADYEHTKKIVQREQITFSSTT